jgi:U3 small nucleolar RNA-associated protein MPP10
VFYADFFEPPPKKKKTKVVNAVSPVKTGKVRFHEEVRVKEIKAKGKKLPLSKNITLSQVFGGDQDEDGDSVVEDEDDGAADEGTFGNEADGLETIERLKDDLFADEEEPEAGTKCRWNC